MSLSSRQLKTATILESSWYGSQQQRSTMAGRSGWVRSGTWNAHRAHHYQQPEVIINFVCQLFQYDGPHSSVLLPIANQIPHLQWGTPTVESPVSADDTQAPYTPYAKNNFHGSVLLEKSIDDFFPGWFRAVGCITRSPRTQSLSKFLPFFQHTKGDIVTNKYFKNERLVSE